MYVTANLKAPDDGEWIALTAVDADGTITPLGYLNRENAIGIVDHASDLLSLLTEYRNS